MQNLIYILNNAATLSEQAIKILTTLSKTKEYSKGTILVEQNHYCRNIYFIEKGFARGFYYKDGKDVTTWFANENEIITSFCAFITQKPSFENIELLESCTLISIDYNSLQKLYHSFPEFNIAGRLLTEKYYVELEERTLSLQFQSAKQRYNNLLEKQPYILQKSSLGNIASFLGMSQETLSRIRGK